MWLWSCPQFILWSFWRRLWILWSQTFWTVTMCQAFWATQWVKPVCCSQDADTESRLCERRLWHMAHQMMNCRSEEPEAQKLVLVTLIPVMLLTVFLGGQWAVPPWSCMTLCDPMDSSPPGSSVHGIFPGKNTGVGCPFLLLHQGIVPIQGLNPCLLHLLHCWQILYPLSHEGSSEAREDTFPVACYFSFS